MPAHTLEERLMSSFPLSLATSLAFETIFTGNLPVYDKDRVTQPKQDIKNYDELWINLSTLFRNMIGSVEDKTWVSFSPEYIANHLVLEIETITGLLRIEGNDVCKPIFYLCSYDDLYKGKYGRAIKVRKDSTAGQVFLTKKLMDTMKLLLKDSDTCISFNTELSPQARSNALMLTHIPIDLTSHKNFKSLSLLESHTGVIKPFFKWNTKLYPVPETNIGMIPFSMKTLAVFGDRVLISPMDIRLRRQIVEIAVKRNWTPMTTRDKIHLDLKLEIKEPYVLQTLLEL